MKALSASEQLLLEHTDSVVSYSLAGLNATFASCSLR